ncbi:hypothetical protein evm_012546 [Chilo suppressalis]|nr:hypothetical protein evm_012546 [Chilo suppressalis]
MPKQIARYLNLPNCKQYIGHCYRRTSAKLLTNSGANITTLTPRKRLGGWKSSTVAEGYIEDLVQNKNKLSNQLTETIKIRPNSPQPTTSREYPPWNPSFDEITESPTFTDIQNSQICKNVHKRTMVFQNDGAPQVRRHLDQTYHNRWIGRRGPIAWPPRSPDLNPIDFFIWGYFKEIVYAREASSEEELRAKIRDAETTISNISPNTRVRDLKQALSERGVKPQIMTWKGFRGFCYLHFFKSGPQKGEGDSAPAAVSMDSVLTALSQMSLGGSGGVAGEESADDKPRLLTVEPAPPRPQRDPHDNQPFGENYFIPAPGVSRWLAESADDKPHLLTVEPAPLRPQRTPHDN